MTQPHLLHHLSHRVFSLSLLLLSSIVTSTELASDATPVALTGNYTLSVIPLSASLLPITPNETITQSLDYLESLVTASWNASISNSISTSNDSLTSTLSFANPGYNSSNLWDICAVTFAVSLTASNVSSPYYGSGNCSELFGDACIFDLQMAVRAQMNFSSGICGGENTITFLPRENNCGDAWNTIDNNLSVQTYLNPVDQFAVLTNPVDANTTNLTEVALAAIYPVMFLEVYKPGLSSGGTEIVTPMVCMQAVNVTSETSASGTSGSSITSSTGTTTTPTAKSDATRGRPVSLNIGVFLAIVTIVMLMYH